jgi:hypothetical protein
VPKGAVFRGLQACGNVITPELQLVCNISYSKGLVSFLLAYTKHFSRPGGPLNITILPPVRANSACPRLCFRVRVLAIGSSLTKCSFFPTAVACCLAQVNPPKLSTLSPEQQRLQSRRLALQCFFQEHCDFDMAVAAYKRLAHDNHAKRVTAVKQFITYQLYKWYERGSVRNRPRKKQRLQVDDEIAKQFAYKLAMGCAQHTSVLVHGQLRDHWHHRRFFDLQDAYKNDRYIQQVMDTCGSIPQLVRRAKAADPDLAWCWQHIKGDISVELKRARQKYSGDQLAKALQDSTYLLDFFWEDEVKIYIAKDRDGKVRVWGHKSEIAHEPPMPCRFAGARKQVCLNLMLVVSARYGIFYLDTLTGTTLINNELIKVAPEAVTFIMRRNHEYYKVGWQLHKQDVRQVLHFTGFSWGHLPSNYLNIWPAAAVCAHLHSVVLICQQYKCCV